MWRIEGVLTQEHERDGFQLFEDEYIVYVKRFGEVCIVLGSSVKREFIWEVVEAIRKSKEPY